MKVKWLVEYKFIFRHWQCFGLNELLIKMERADAMVMVMEMIDVEVAIGQVAVLMELIGNDEAVLVQSIAQLLLLLEQGVSPIHVGSILVFY